MTHLHAGIFWLGTGGVSKKSMGCGLVSLGLRMYAHFRSRKFLRALILHRCIV